jgi:arylsulfatase
VHEGGIATPLIVRFPGAARGGQITHALAHVIDILPTCLEAAGAAYPEQHDGEAITPAEGRSLLPAARGEGGDDDRTIYWEHEGNRAVRRGRWKLVAKHRGPWELYDMVEDRTELTDLADKKPDTVAQMEALYDRWAGTHDVLPFDQARPGR